MLGIRIALVLATLFVAMAATAARAAERILRVSYSAPATAYLPLWAARDARELNPAALIYNRLTEEVARSGIVERLYK